MKHVLRSLILGIVAMLSTGLVRAQMQSKLVIVNGGTFEFTPPFADYVTVALYDPATREYAVKDTIPDQSVQDIKIYGDTAFVVTDNGLSTFKLPDLTPISRNGGQKGIRSIMVVGSKVYAARGFGWLPGEDYVYIFDRNTLAPAGSVAGITAQCEDIVYAAGKLYVSVPGDFTSDTGMVVRINPATNQIDSTIHLGNTGRGIGQLTFRNNILYGFANGAAGAGDISLYTFDLLHHAATHYALTPQIGFSHLAVYKDSVFGQFGSGLAVSHYTDIPNRSPQAISPVSYAGIAADTIRRQLYVSQPNYSTPSQLYTMSLRGQITDSIQIGIAAERMAVFYHPAVAVKKGITRTASIMPNPATTTLQVVFEAGAEYSIVDGSGRVVRSGKLRSASTRLDLADLTPGLYHLILQSELGNAVQKFGKL